MKKPMMYNAVKKEELPISSASINVFIIGSHGYSQNYGGWETFVHGLIDHSNDESIHFYVYEKVEDCNQTGFFETNGITCIRVFEKRTGSSAMMIYDKKCTDMTCELVKEYKMKNPIMFHLGVRIGPYLFWKHHAIKKLGITMMENPAGAEWRRTKWNKRVQLYLFVSALLMARSVDCMVCDNEGIRDIYRKMPLSKKKKMECIAYGVEPVPVVSERMPNKVIEYFNQWKIEKDGYYLILGRFVPENNYEMMFKGFMQTSTDRKLLVICNYQTEMEKFFEYIKEQTGFEKDRRIIMAGTLFDKEILHYVRQYAHGYIHGHSVGGTNPGLLEAMNETNVNILFDVPFNRYVGGEAALYFSSSNELCERILYIDREMSKINQEEYGRKAKKRMSEKYSWEYITNEYNRVFKAIVEDKNENSNHNTT